MQQYIAEKEIAFAAITEPICIPQGNWIGSKDRKAAIQWKQSKLRSICKVTMVGERCVAVTCGKMVLFSCYVSPNVPDVELDNLLIELDIEIGKFTSEIIIIITGDFNSKSYSWGSSMIDNRGDNLETWAASHGLILLNDGFTPTCNRPQGQSVTDLTWISRNAVAHVTNWRVNTQALSLSDHLYIEYKIKLYRQQNNNTNTNTNTNNNTNTNTNNNTYTNTNININTNNNTNTRKIYPRWSSKSMDVELFQETIKWYCNCKGEAVNDGAAWIREVMTKASDASMKKVKPPANRKQVHWWTEAINVARKVCIRSRRIWTRAKKRQDLDLCAYLKEEYKNKVKSLKKLINQEKENSWRALIAEIENDPWGLPFKLVLNKLRAVSRSTTELLEPSTLKEILHKLFPRAKNMRRLDRLAELRWEEEWDVTPIEVYSTIKKAKSKEVAPGPDGVTRKIWRQIPDILCNEIAEIYTNYLKNGVFPDIWKASKLVLIPKTPLDIMQDSHKMRPICLIDEIGKIFEKILINRIYKWMENREGIISPNQHGFRKNHSTVDALLQVTSIIEKESKNGNITVAVSVDVENAFNSLPWKKIKEALYDRKFPRYLRRIIYSYLSNRYIEYITQENTKERMEVQAGVPQGSVIGPYLWILTYDTVLRVTKEPGTDVYCYADDTIILASAENFDNARTKACIVTERVLHRIRNLGLKVAIHKTEVGIFCTRRGLRPPPDASIIIDGKEIPVKTEIKYLGIILDCRLSYAAHFKYVEEKATKISRALCRLMPNLRGPHETKRRLYAYVIQSVVTYGAPVWSDKLNRSTVLQRPLRRMQRILAIRVISGYRTIGFDVATLLARTPPWTLVAEKLKNTYHQIKELRISEEWSEQAEKDIISEENDRMYNRWRHKLTDAYLPGAKIRTAIVESFQSWINRRYGGMNFRLTQMITGHGCYNSFLYRIKRSETSICAHCRTRLDTVEHTIQECNTWEAHRGQLVAVLQCNLDLPDIIKAICNKEDNWLAFNAFAQEVLLVKENEERERERNRNDRLNRSRSDS